MHLYEVLDRVLRRADAAGRLHPDPAPGLLVDVADRLQHHELHRQRRRAGQLARRRLDEVPAGRHREQRRAPDVVVRAELRDLEDHLQVRLAARLLDAHDLVVDLGVAARQERAPVDHHVDLVGAHRHSVLDVAHLDVERRLSGGEVRRHAGDLHAGAAQLLLRGRHEVRVDADRGDARDVGVGRVGPDRLRAERGDLARRVLPLQRRQVAAADRELERPDLRLLLDAALRQLARARLDRDLVDRADPRQPLLQRQLEPGGKCRRLRHAPSLAASREPTG